MKKLILFVLLSAVGANMFAAGGTLSASRNIGGRTYGGSISLSPATDLLEKRLHNAEQDLVEMRKQLEWWRTGYRTHFAQQSRAAQNFMLPDSDIQENEKQYRELVAEAEAKIKDIKKQLNR